MSMARLSAEQRQKINDLVRGKFYKFTPPVGHWNPISRIGRFQYLTNASFPNAELVFGMPAFRQRAAEDPCSYEGPSMGQYNLPVSYINNIVPINAPEGAGADWVPSVFCGGARKTRRGRASRSKRSKRGSRRK
jgi:hypothetical protein